MASVAARIKAREVEAGAHLPYLRHVTEQVISLSTRALITTIRLSGVSFETADAADLNDLHAKLNLTLRNIADERLALWTHVIRRRVADYPEGAFRSTFARELNEAYRARLVSETLLSNELYLTLVWHPGRDATERASLFFSRLARATRAGVEVDTFGLKKLNDVSRDLTAALARYHPRRLGLIGQRGLIFSETASFLQELVACQRLPFPLVKGRIGPALYANRLIFGREMIEIRSPGCSRFAGMLAFKDYPATTRPGLLDGLLAAPFELVLAQSFAFLGKAEAKAVMTRKQNQLLSTNDPAASQIGELDAALDDLESNRFVMGEHHLSLLLLADEPRALLDRMSQARRILADAGAVVAREDLGLEAAVGSHLGVRIRIQENQ